MSNQETKKYDLSGEELYKAFETKDNHMIFIKRKLDSDIGYNYWKKYVASAFWAQISTPINLTITFLTAITTAQAQTQGLITQELFSQLAIVSLIITTLNTFFRPHTQYATNTEYLGKWNDIGVNFEKEYCDKVDTKNPSNQVLKALDLKIEKYNLLQDDVQNLRKAEGTATVNFLTDLIFLLAYSTCIRNDKKWLDMDKRIMKKTAEDFDTFRKEQREKQLKHELEEREREFRFRVSMAEIEKREEEILSDIKNPVKLKEIIIGENKIPEPASQAATEGSGAQEMT